jgi:hypothetical protein
MIRLSLLQFRVQAITAAVTLGAFTILLAATGPHLASMYAADGLDSCHGGSSCANLANYFTASLVRSPYAVLWLLSGPRQAFGCRLGRNAKSADGAGHCFTRSFPAVAGLVVPLPALAVCRVRP